MRYILLTLFVMLLTTLTTRCQDLANMQAFKTNHEYLEDKYIMPVLRKPGRIVRTKTIQITPDSVDSHVDLEYRIYKDRYAEITYDSEGTLDEEFMVIFLDSFNTLSIAKYYDESYVELDSIFKAYNTNKLLLSCETRYYESGDFYGSGISINTYNENNRLTKKSYYNKEKELKHYNDILYNSNGNIDKVEYYDKAGELVQYRSYYRNKWAEDKLYSIHYFRPDSTMTYQVILPENPQYPDNNYTTKSYGVPSVRSTSTLKTTVVEIEDDPESNEGRLETITYYRDHIVFAKVEKYYNKEGWIEKEMQVNVKRPSESRIITYSYLFLDY